MGQMSHRILLRIWKRGITPLCSITKYEENKVTNVTFEFTYNEPILVYKNLNNQVSKLKEIVSMSNFFI